MLVTTIDVVTRPAHDDIVSSSFFHPRQATFTFAVSILVKTMESHQMPSTPQATLTRYIGPTGSLKPSSPSWRGRCSTARYSVSRQLSKSWLALARSGVGDASVAGRRFHGVPLRCGPTRHNAVLELITRKTWGDGRPITSPRHRCRTPLCGVTIHSTRRGWHPSFDRPGFTWQGTMANGRSRPYHG